MLNISAKKFFHQAYTRTLYCNGLLAVLIALFNVLVEASWRFITSETCTLYFTLCCELCMAAWKKK